ncbi:MAG: S41 family peptidase [Prevotella sp.]|nr:S41 family peptidase [Prevotella sp.]
MKKGILTAALMLVSLCVGAQENLQLQKLQMAEWAITNLYVENVDEKKLVEDAIRGMLSQLDPHSSYATKEQMLAMQESLNGNFEGIGVEFNIKEDTLLVIQPVLGGPSERVGIQAGDRIVAVDGEPIAGVKMSQEDIKRKLRGPKGTKVTLGVVRRGIAEPLSFVVERDKIPVKSVNASYMIRPGVGYIRIGGFGATTHKEFTDALKKLQNDGMTSLILDLQDNGGGYMVAAVDICNEFLENRDLIVYTDGREHSEYNARGNGMFMKGKLMVLINEYTASAAEIVSGAVQDQDRGYVVGRRSFGKGLVQRQINLPDTSMIRLTIAHYYTPAGRCIQKPYTKGQSDDYARDMQNRLKRGELTSADSIHFADSLKYYTLRRHRTVYGGGGIMPDYFVPLDTTQYTRFHRAMQAKGLVINANLRYVDTHRSELKEQYRTFAEYRQTFEVPQTVIDELVDEAEKQDIKPENKAEMKTTLPYLKLQLKALIARDLWGMDEYFAIMNEQNAIVQEAIRLMEQE